LQGRPVMEKGTYETGFTKIKILFSLIMTHLFQKTTFLFSLFKKIFLMT